MGVIISRSGNRRNLTSTVAACIAIAREENSPCSTASTITISLHPCKSRESAQARPIGMQDESPINRMETRYPPVGPAPTMRNSVRSGNDMELEIDDRSWRKSNSP